MSNAHSNKPKNRYALGVLAVGVLASLLWTMLVPHGFANFKAWNASLAVQASALVLAVAAVVFLRIKPGSKGTAASLVTAHGNATIWNTSRTAASLVTAHGNATIWNTSRTGARFDPGASTGPWAPAKDVKAFLVEVPPFLSEAATSDEAASRENAVHGLLRHQLGPQWRGVREIKENYAHRTHLKNHLAYQCMAVIAGVHARDRKDGLRIRMMLAEALSGDDEAECMARAAAIIAPHLADADLVRKIDRRAGRHAFLTTAMMGLIEWARDESGILPPSEFLWLKGYSRNLWYALSDLGCGAIHVEAAGSTAHYRAEKAAGVALAIPRVQSAVDFVMGGDATL